MESKHEAMLNEAERIKIARAREQKVLHDKASASFQREIRQLLERARNRADRAKEGASERT